LGSWALVLIPVAISLFRKRATSPVSPLTKNYRLFCERMARLGLERAPGETPAHFAQRAATAVPGYAEQLLRITGMYNALAYGAVDEQTSATELRNFIREVIRFRPDRRRGQVEDAPIV
jgi:hypothetical protein